MHALLIWQIRQCNEHEHEHEQWGNNDRLMLWPPWWAKLWHFITKKTIRVIKTRLSFIEIHCSVCPIDISFSASAAANSLSFNLVLRTRYDLIRLSQCCKLFKSKNTGVWDHIMMKNALRCVVKVLPPAGNIDGCFTECCVCTYIWHLLLVFYPHMPNRYWATCQPNIWAEQPNSTF